MNPRAPLSLFASVPLDDLAGPSNPVGPAIHDSLIMLGAILFVTACAALWLVYFRKRRHTSDHHSHRHHRQRAGGDMASSPLSEIRPIGEQRKRRRRREHRPRNPTLAQTGGLPPIRQDEPPAPPQSQAQPQ